MRVIRHQRYGGPEVVALEDREIPTPGPGQVLVRITAASVNPLDWHGMRGEPRLMRFGSGLRRPRSGVLGADYAGTIAALGPALAAPNGPDVAVGAAVAPELSGLAVGDAVFGMSAATLADFAVVSTAGAVPLPSGVEPGLAAAVPVAGITALQALRDIGGLRSGQRVLVLGASGGVGTLAVQLAVAMGADVTGTCSTRNLELVRRLGAATVIDYTQEDLDRADFDMVLDLAGDRSVNRLRRLARSGGRIVLVAAGPGRWIRPLWRVTAATLLNPFRRTTARAMLAHRRYDDLALLGRHLADGTLVPVIDRVVPLEETAEALRYLETGRARGKVIVSL